MLWVHTLKGKHHFLLYPLDRDSLEDDVEVGETVDDFKFDKDKYNTQFASFVAKHASHVKKKKRPIVQPKPDPERWLNAEKRR